MTLRNRLVKLEASRGIGQRAELHPDLWPLIGSPYRHEDFIELIAREQVEKKTEADDGNA